MRGDRVSKEKEGEGVRERVGENLCERVYERIKLC